VASAQSYAGELARLVAPSSMKTIKQQIYQHLNVTPDVAMEASLNLMERSIEQPDFKEGVASYLEKRDPSFRPVV
jgi:enoyl-CoA hydratase/carnithine racemase